MVNLEVLDLNHNQYLQEMDVFKQHQVKGGSDLSVSNTVTLRSNGSIIALNTIAGNIPDGIDALQLNFQGPNGIRISAEELGLEISQTNQIVVP